MDAVTLINNHLDVRKLLQHYDFEKVSGSGLIRSACKIHNGTTATSFVINEETGLWYCHSGCGGGDTFTLIEKMEQVSFPDAVHIASQIFDIDISGAEIVERKPKYIKETEKWLRNMKSRKVLPHQKYIIPVETKRVIKYRDFKQETLEFFDVQYVEKIEYKNNEGKISTLYKRILVPIYFNQMLVGASLRKTRAEDYIKWCHLPTGILTGNLLYNYDNAKVFDEIVIVEGLADVWRYFEIGIEGVVSPFGSKLSNEQQKLLIKTGADLVLSYDNDIAGIKATNKVFEQMHNKANIKRIILPDEKDPGDCTLEELLVAYEGRKR